MISLGPQVAAGVVGTLLTGLVVSALAAVGLRGTPPRRR